MINHLSFIGKMLDFLSNKCEQILKGINKYLKVTSATKLFFAIN